MTYYIYAIKATRQPVFVDQQEELRSAQLVATTAYQVTQLLHSKELASSGISYQIFDAPLPTETSLPKALFQVGSV